MLEWSCMLCHMFHLLSYCVSMLSAYFSHSRTSICWFDCLAFFFFQMNGKECLRTPSSYLCFSRLKLYSCYITKFDQVRFEPPRVRSTRSPRFVIDLYFQNLFVHFGMTESSTSVTPSSLSWSRFSISVQPIWTFRSHRVAVTASSFASRCHRVVPLGHTDSVRLYILTGQILENFPKTFSPARDLLCRLGSPDHLLAASDLPPLDSATVNGNPHRQCRRSKSTAELGYGLDFLCYSLTLIRSTMHCHVSSHSSQHWFAHMVLSIAQL